MIFEDNKFKCDILFNYIYPYKMRGLCPKIEKNVVNCKKMLTISYKNTYNQKRKNEKE